MHSSIETCPVSILGTWTLRWGVTSARTSPASQTSLRRRISRPPEMHCSGREDGQLTHQSRHRRAGPARPPCPAGAQPVGGGVEAAGGVRRGHRHADGLPSTPARCGRHTSALESPGKGCSSGEMGDIVLVTRWSRKEDVQRKILKLKLKPECTETQHRPQWP